MGDSGQEAGRAPLLGHTFLEIFRKYFPVGIDYCLTELWQEEKGTGQEGWAGEWMGEQVHQRMGGRRARGREGWKEG